MQNNTYKIIISPEKILKFMLMAIAILAGLSILGRVYLYYLSDMAFLKPVFRIGRFLASFVYLDNEGNFASFYAVVLLLITAAITGIIAYIKISDKNKFSLHWSLLSLTFLYLSFDDFYDLHGKVCAPLRKMFAFNDFLYYAWVIPALVLVIAFALFYLKFLFHLPGKTRYLVAAAGFLYVGGAAGMEMIASHYIQLHGLHNFTYSMLVAIEESMELTGITLMIYAMLSYIRSYTIDFTVSGNEFEISASKELNSPINELST